MGIEIRTTKDNNELRYEVGDSGEVRASFVDHYGRIKPIEDPKTLETLQRAVDSLRIGSHIQQDAELLRHNRDTLMKKTGLDPSSPAIQPYDEPYRVADLTAHNLLMQAAAAFSKAEHYVDKLADEPLSGHGLTVAANKPSDKGRA